MSNAVLRLPAGTALGFGDGLGLIVVGQGALLSEGTVAQPVQVASYAGVQEDLSQAPVNGTAYPLYAWRAGTAGSEARLRCTRFTALASGFYALYQVDTLSFTNLTVRDCEFRNGRVQLDQATTSTTRRATLANNMFVNVQVGQEYWDDAQQGVDFFANTLRGGSLYISSGTPDAWGLHDNLFHEATVYMYLNGTHGYNAYLGTNVFTEGIRHRTFVAAPRLCSNESAMLSCTV